MTWQIVVVEQSLNFNLGTDGVNLRQLKRFARTLRLVHTRVDRVEIGEQLEHRLEMVR